MKHLTKLSIAVTSVALALTATSQAARAVSVNFSQVGYSEGASITGMFTGKDLNNDGAISSFDSEVTDYMVSFSGNSLVPAFSHGFPNLVGLVYVLGSQIGDFFPDDGIISGDGVTIYSTSGGTGIFPPFSPGGNIGTIAGASDFTPEFVTVTPKNVPEPFTILGTGTALGFITLFKRKLNRKQPSDKA